MERGIVCVFGSMNMDLSVACERMPRAGETVAGGGFLANAGGKGANQAIAAARMGARTYMVGAVGCDGFGRELVAGLEDAGVDCTHVERCADAETGTATIIRCAGDNRIVLSAGANHAMAADEAEAALRAIVCSELAGGAAEGAASTLGEGAGAPAVAAESAACEAAGTGDGVPVEEATGAGAPAADALGCRIAPAAGSVFIAQGECDLDATAHALAAAHALGFYTVFNPAPACELPAWAWEHVDAVCPNETECEALTGVLPGDDASCVAALEALCAKGPATAVITLGGAGSATLAEDGGLLRMPSLSREVVDTTAAGDTYIGAFAAERAAGAPLFECMVAGARAAAITVSRLGAQQSIPTRAQVEQWLQGEAE